MFVWLTTLAWSAAPVDAWLDAVVLVQQGSTSCAGARIDADGTVATAYHCVAAGGRPRIQTRGGASAIGRVVGVDVRADLALIDVPPLRDGAFLPLGPPPASGDAVWALGHPYGEDAPGGFFAGTLRWSASSGSVSAVGPIALQVDTALNPGNSGGPIVDENGCIVGVASRRLGNDGLGFAGRADLLQALLERERGLSPIGGTVAAEAFVASQDGAAGSVAVGARLEVAFRDRLLLDGAGLLPLSARWSAARFGASVTGLGELRLGWRTRFGRGPWAVRIDGQGGVVALQSVTSAPEDPLALTTEVTPTWIVGGTARLRQVGFELAWLPDAGLTRASAVLRWPGVFGVF